MKLEKYEDKRKKNRKAILISFGVIVLISVSLLLYKTFASFSETVEFQVMKGQVDYFGNSDVYFAFYNGSDKLDSMPLKDNEENLVFDYGECDNGAYVEWNNDRWSPLIINLTQNKTKCSLYFKEKTSINICNKYGNDSALCYISKLGDSDYVNMAYDHASTNGVLDNNLRYIGANPNNYVLFNEEKWRIIGILKVKTEDGNMEDRLKIIRSDSIGTYSWDFKLNGVGSSISDFGSSDWTDSQLKDMLNGIYYESGIGNCYKNQNVSEPVQCDFSGFGSEPKGLDEMARNMIDANIVWTLGSRNNSNSTTKEFYEAERGTLIWQGHPNEWNSKTDVGDKFNGVGLFYPSDYGYAVGGEVREICLVKTLYDSASNDYRSDNCKDYNWLLNNLTQWSISSISTYSNSPYYVRDLGNLAHNLNANRTLSVRPVVHLTTDVKIEQDSNENYGSFDNPFRLTK